MSQGPHSENPSEDDLTAALTLLRLQLPQARIDGTISDTERSQTTGGELHTQPTTTAIPDANNVARGTASTTVQIRCTSIFTRSTESPLPYDLELITGGVVYYKVLRNRTIPLGANAFTSFNSRSTSPASSVYEERDEKRKRKKPRKSPSINIDNDKVIKRKSGHHRRRQSCVSDRSSRRSSSDRRPRLCSSPESSNRPQTYMTSAEERKAYLESHPCRFTFNGNITTEAVCGVEGCPYQIFKLDNRSKYDTFLAERHATRHHANLLAAERYVPRSGQVVRRKCRNNY